MGGRLDILGQKNDKFVVNITIQGHFRSRTGHFMRRKKRYKHATIGKKKYYFYKIVWLDPCGDAGHAEVEEMKKLKPATMVSQAYIFAKDKKHVWTFASYDTEQAVFSDRNCFPRSIIVKMERITL